MYKIGLEELKMIYLEVIEHSKEKDHGFWYFYKEIISIGEKGDEEDVCRDCLEKGRRLIMKLIAKKERKNQLYIYFQCPDCSEITELKIIHG